MNNQENCSDEERFLWERLKILQEQYIKAQKPYLERLAEIHALKMPLPIKAPFDPAYMFEQYVKQIKKEDN